jgi:hypothetical protein
LAAKSAVGRDFKRRAAAASPLAYVKSPSSMSSTAPGTDAIASR